MQLEVEVGEIIIFVRHTIDFLKRLVDHADLDDQIARPGGLDGFSGSCIRHDGLKGFLSQGEKVLDNTLSRFQGIRKVACLDFEGGFRDARIKGIRHRDGNGRFLGFFFFSKSEAGQADVREVQVRHTHVREI